MRISHAPNLSGSRQSSRRSRQRMNASWHTSSASRRLPTRASATIYDARKYRRNNASVAASSPTRARATSEASDSVILPYDDSSVGENVSHAHISYDSHLRDAVSPTLN